MGFKKLFSNAMLIGAAIFAAQTAIVSVAKANLKTVDFVDLNKYAGDWYQIAHRPLFFEGGPCACTRQRLAPADAAQAGVITVFNSCNDKDSHGKLKTISGEAYSDDTASNSKFTVDFHLPFKGTYWIIGLDPQYRYAVVTDKYSYSFYILSKTPTLDINLYKEAVAIGSAQGLDESKLETTDQNNCTYPN